MMMDPITPYFETKRNELPPELARFGLSNAINIRLLRSQSELIDNTQL
jgi:hypothetical protein